MRKRKILILLLCIFLSIQLFTTITFADTRADQVLRKALNIKIFMMLSDLIRVILLAEMEYRFPIVPVTAQLLSSS